MPPPSVTFVVPVNDESVFQTNFLASPSLPAARQAGVKVSIIAQKGYRNAADAYNAALADQDGDLFVFAHQDLFLPERWLIQLQESIAFLDKADPHWGVLGCWGVRSDGSFAGHVFSTGLGVLGGPRPHPVLVATLDEIVLIMRRGSGLRFDQRVTGFHFYGSALCLVAQSKGQSCYAISAFCIHNTKPLITLPNDFYRCYWQFRRAWKQQLPVQTTCVRVSRWSKAVWIRRLRELYLHTRFGRRTVHRMPDPAQIWRGLYPDLPGYSGD